MGEKEGNAQYCVFESWYIGEKASYSMSQNDIQYYIYIWFMFDDTLCGKWIY